MADIRWVDHHIEVTPPKHPKKITGTRMAGIFGLNKWVTPFRMWCEITKTWEQPFVSTKYTEAGKVIEPKQAAFMKDAYGMSNLRTPTDIFGPDYFKSTYGDFFHGVKIFGGMWDYILVDENGKATTVLEMKTTKRAEDWSEDIPEYYALQAALYAYLLGVDKVIMVATVLEESDYDHPENFRVTAENTFLVPFRLSERYPDFAERVNKAVDWWEKHVEEGISPDYDAKKDKEILDELRSKSVSALDDEQKLLAEAEQLQRKLDAVKAETDMDEKRLKILKDWIKDRASRELSDGIDKVDITGQNLRWVLSRTQSRTVDTDALKKDGLYEKYSKPTEKLTLTVKPISD